MGDRGRAYGQVKYLRVWLERHDAPYVLATKRNDTLITAGPDFGFAEQRADTLIATLTARVIAGRAPRGDRPEAARPARALAAASDTAPRGARQGAALTR